MATPSLSVSTWPRPVRQGGLEFDGVVVMGPHDVLSEHTDSVHTRGGARLLYVAMTRAVHRLALVADAPAREVIAR